MRSRPTAALRPTASSVVTAGLLAAVLATTAARPLYHADLWAHLAYGRHVLATGGVAETEPLMPLAAGVRFVNPSWLSGVLGALLYDAAGPEGLRLAGGLLVAAAVGAVGAAGRWRGRTAWAGWLAGGGFLAVAWFQLHAFAPWDVPLGPQMLRPQTVGLALYCGLLAATPVPPRPGWRWVGLPLGFLLWANCHGSWPVGLAWLGVDWLNRAVPLRFAAVRSRRARRGALLIGLCAAACCGTPYGPAAYADVLMFGRDPNLSDVIEWGPLTLGMRQGRIFAVAAGLLAAALILSPRRTRWPEVAALVVVGALACGTSRWVLWWAGPAAVLFASHLAAAVGRGRPGTVRPSPRRTAAVWAGGLLAGVALSVPAWRLAAGQAAGANCLAHGTPVRAAAFLREHPPAGQLFHAHGFGDFLLIAGPPGVRIFLGSHAHLIPPPVWEDAKRLSAAEPGWAATLDRYGVTTLMLSRRENPRLIGAATAAAEWQVVHEDPVAVIFERAGP